MSVTMTPDQKRQLFHDGYIVLKGVVAPDLVARAQARIKGAKKGENLGSAAEITDLVNASAVTPILNEVMGQFDPPSHCQVGVIKPGGPQDYFSPLGYRERDLPYFGHGMHAEGLFTVSPPQSPISGGREEVYGKLIAGGPKGDIGRCADVIGSNTDPLFQDPEMTLSVGSFTAFVIVPLNDQMAEGCGQTAVIPGGHRILEGFYRWQHEQNGCIGPEGPGWPRFDYTTPNGAGHVYLPDPVQQKLIELDDQPPETTPDGRAWPRPTPILMAPGDVAITLFQMPHTGTRNERGTESRKNMIFRIRNKSRQPDKVATGVSDHPDRGQMGEWLEYEEGNNPWDRSKYALTHMWHEWEGMQQVVKEESPRVAPVDYSHVKP